MSELQKTGSGDELRVVIPMSNKEIGKSVLGRGSPDGSHSEKIAELTAINSSEMKSISENSPNNESASRIKSRFMIPKTPSMSPSRSTEEDDNDIMEEIIKKRKKMGRQWNFGAGDFFLWAVNLCILGCLVASCTVEKLESKMFWGLRLWKWCVFGMALFCGKLLVNWTIHFIVLVIGRNFTLRSKALYFVVGLKNSSQYFAWMLLVLTVWKYLLDHKTTQSTSRIFKYVTRTIISTLIGSFLFLLKRLWLLVLAYNFHINAFFDKMQETIFHQYVLQTLSGPPLIEEAQMIGESTSLGKLSFRKNKRVTEKLIDISSISSTMKRENVSSWTMKVLADTIRNSPLSTIGDEFSGDEDREICNEMEATAAAYNIFRNVARPGCKYICEEDLLRFMIKEEAYLVFSMIGGHEYGRINRKSLTDWVIRAYIGRKMLSLSIETIENIIEQVNRIVTWILVVVVIILWIALMQVIKLDVIVLLLSAAAFMLGNPCKSLFDAIIFVFIVHPFDVGDRCVVDGIELLVEEINILTTEFLKANNEKVLYPNSVLATKPISNYYRSPDMGDAIEFSIDYSTPKEKIGCLKERIKRYLEKSPHHWHPQHSITVKNVENFNKINMILYCHHCINFQEFGEKNNRRAELLEEIIRTFEDLSIQFYDIRCSDKFAAGLPGQQ